MRSAVVNFYLHTSNREALCSSDTCSAFAALGGYCSAGYQDLLDMAFREKWMDVYAWALTVLEMYAGKRLWETGAEAKAHLEEIFQQFRIGAGEAIQKLLLDCLATNIYNFTDIQENLCEIYKDRR